MSKIIPYYLFIYTGAQQIKKMRAVHMKKNQNAVFYCTTTEIDYGSLNTQNWGPIFENMCNWQEQSTFMLASEAFPKFLDHPSSIEMITKLRQREVFIFIFVYICI